MKGMENAALVDRPVVATNDFTSESGNGLRKLETVSYHVLPLEVISSSILVERR